MNTCHECGGQTTFGYLCNGDIQGRDCLRDLNGSGEMNDFWASPAGSGPTLSYPPPPGFKPGAWRAAAQVTTPAPAPTAGTCIGCGKQNAFGLPNLNFCDWPNSTGSIGPGILQTTAKCGLSVIRCYHCTSFTADGQYDCSACGMSLGLLAPVPTPQTAPGNSIAAAFQTNAYTNNAFTAWVDETLPGLTADPPARKCESCNVDWCEYLDAYHGKDPRQCNKCARCRR